MRSMMIFLYFLKNARFFSEFCLLDCKNVTKFAKNNKKISISFFV